MRSRLEWQTGICDEVHLRHRNPRCVKTELHGLQRQFPCMFLTREAFFFRSDDKNAITHKGGAGVVAIFKMRSEAEDVQDDVPVDAPFDCRCFVDRGRNRSRKLLPKCVRNHRSKELSRDDTTVLLSLYKSVDM